MEDVQTNDSAPAPPAERAGGDAGGESRAPAERPPAGGRPPRRGGGRFGPRRKVCIFCVDHIDRIDYKDVGRLRRYISERGKIEPRRKTGTCARHQRRLAIALKRARHIALLPFTTEHIRATGASFGPQR